MACGVPVVAATAGALPDTVGDAGLLVDPRSERELADAVIAAAFDETLRQRLRAAGLERAAAYSWPRAVRQTDAVIDELFEAAS
jgi:glycosyltransferase involved in cell wall biosynthesis